MNTTFKDDMTERDIYLHYLLNGGRLTKNEFNEVINYVPQEEEIRKYLWMKIPEDDLKLILRIYHVVSKRKPLCSIDDVEIVCEYRALRDIL